VSPSIADVPGIAVGCWTDAEGLTGCTVVLCPPGAVVAAEVRGGAPGTRETDLARPGMLVERAQAVLLTGGSAYGLDAASGVMRWLEERGWGVPAAQGVVPVVPAAVVFDLGVGSFGARPGPAEGYAACVAAGLEQSGGGGGGGGAAPRRGPDVPEGSAGAGTGCTVGKRLGLAGAMRGGQGTAAVRLEIGPAAVTVGALVAVNAVGDVYDPATGRLVAGARRPDGTPAGEAPWRSLPGAPSRPLSVSAAAAERPPDLNTTIGVVATDAPLTKEQAQRVAWMAHDGLARAVRPAHTLGDGDTLFVLATGRAAEGAPGLPPVLDPLHVSAIGAAGADAVGAAIVRAVRAALPLPGIPAASGWSP
jgi:L-aminopeptidase/D-esterase-like protein